MSWWPSLDHGSPLNHQITNLQEVLRSPGSPCPPPSPVPNPQGFAVSITHGFVTSRSLMYGLLSGFVPSLLGMVTRFQSR